MSLEKLTQTEKQIAWKVLDALQNEIKSNKTLSIKDVFRRFDFIQELKDQVDVRKTKEKLSSKSILPYLEGKKETECENLQQFQNRLCRLFRFNNKHLVSPIKR